MTDILMIALTIAVDRGVRRLCGVLRPDHRPSRARGPGARRNRAGRARRCTGACGVMLAISFDNLAGLVLALAAIAYLIVVLISTGTVLMSWRDVFEIAALVVLLGLTVPPLGRYVAVVYRIALATARRPATASSFRSSERCTGSCGSTRNGSSDGTSTPSHCWPSRSCRCWRSICCGCRAAAVQPDRRDACRRPVPSTLRSAS